MEPTSKQEPTETTGPKGTWLVVANTCGRYIGMTAWTKEQVLEALAKGAHLEMSDIFEFHCQVALEPVTLENGNAGQRVAKNPFLLRPDLTLYQTTMYLSLQGALVYLLNDLKGGDAQVYKDQLQTAVQLADAWQKERAAKTSGLVTASQLPKVPLPGVRRA